MEITQELLNKVQELAENLTPISEMSVLWILRRMFCVMRFSTLHQSSGASIIWAWQKSGSRFAGMSWSWLQPAHLKPYSAHMNI